MKEIIFFYEHCRQNHLLFHALEKRTDSDTPLGLSPPPASLQPPPVSLVCARGWRVTANEEGAAMYFLCARKKENATISVLSQAAGDKAASFCHSLLACPWVSHCTQVPPCNAERKALFLPGQDVVRIKKYIKDSWMVSYYGNTATWLCIEGLWGHICHATLHICAPKICPLACTQLWKDQQLRLISVPPSTFSATCHGAKDGVPALGTWEVSGRGLFLGCFPSEGEMGSTGSLSYNSWDTWDYIKVGTAPKSSFFQNGLCDQRRITGHHFWVVLKGRIKRTTVCVILGLLTSNGRSWAPPNKHIYTCDVKEMYPYSSSEDRKESLLSK